MLLEPTALASALRYLAESLEQDYALDPASLFARAGFPMSRTHESGARVSQRAAWRLWDLSIAATGDPGCGLNVGRRVRPEGLHALGYAWMSSRNLVDAFNRFCRYAEVLINIPVNWSLQGESGAYRFTATFPDPAHQPHPAGVEATLLALVSLAGQAAGKPVRPQAVWLQHACRTDRARYTAAFGAPVSFAALQTQPVAANVRDMLLQLLPTGEVGQETVARRLNRSLSTLQRQLQAEGL
ncbi:MAG: AraC family transcriptional regulator, partial [Gammaproteobacteria bacterium]|nr:AraC family transcriptional regulator [Gammaproteobacteria bacterium]